MRDRVFGDHGRPRVRLLCDDPYLAYLLEADSQPWIILTGDVEDGDGASVVVADVDDPRVADLRRSRPDTHVVGVAHSGAEPEEGRFDAVLLRPYAPAEVQRVMRDAAGVRPLRGGRSPLAVIRSLQGAARVVAVAVAGLIELLGDSPADHRLYLLAAAVYVLGRLVMRRPEQLWVVLDVAVASALLALTGGHQSSYILLGVIASIDAGFVLGVGWGTVAGLVVALGTAPELLRMSEAAGGLGGPIAAFVLFPLTALAAGQGERIARTRDGHGVEALSQANRVLSQLYEISRSMPGGFELHSIAAAAVEEAVEALDSPAGVLLIEEAGLLNLAATSGLPGEPDLPPVPFSPLIGRALERESGAVEARRLPEPLATALASHESWLATPVHHGSVRHGVLLTAVVPGERTDRQRTIVSRIATETALAIENAKLFARVRSLAVDDERRRLAHELHDGLAQMLAHLRFELELLGRTAGAGAPSVADESRRLVRVVERGLTDVRHLVNGLQTELVTDGLVGSLREYVRDLQGVSGPRLKVDVQVAGSDWMDPAGQAEVFRIAQEAVSNALRHAAADTVIVSLRSDEGGLMLAVEDDGIGMTSGRERLRTDGGGLGLPAMHERARRVGGELSIDRARFGGTRVELRVARADAGARRGGTRR